MRRVDLIRILASAMQAIEQSGVRLEDWRWVALYDEWVRMKNEGHKYEYIVYYLGEKFGISATSVYRIVKRLEKPISANNAK